MQHRHIAVLGLSALVWSFAPARPLAEEKPRKIVLIAGRLDPNHPSGTHEYEKSVRLLKECLNGSPNLKAVQVEDHYQGWPKDDSTLEDADAVVLVSSGSDRNEKDHPLLVADRLQVLGKQMKRGCGLVTIHWTTFFPNDRARDTMLEWVGGYFDYQSGPPPRKWLSAIGHLETTARPGAAEHAVCRGVKPFKVREEFYYRMRFRENDPRLTPILLADIPGEKEPQIVAWAVQRRDGGRGFGFTGGHYFDNWQLPEFRKLVLNAIVWAAKGEVPEGGVESKPPHPQPLSPKGERGESLKPLSPKGERGEPLKPLSPLGERGRGEGVPHVDADWTPRPGPDWAEPWEKEKDKDWVDGRFRETDTGPTFNGTLKYPFFVRGAEMKLFAYKGTAIRLGDRGDNVEAAVLFDRNQLRLAAGWVGGFLKHSDVRFGLLNTPTPAGSMVFSSSTGPGWAGPDGKWETSQLPTAPLPKEWAKFRGLYLHGKRVLLMYQVGGDSVVESPWVETSGDLSVLSRTVSIGPSARTLRMLVCDLSDSERDLKVVDGGQVLAGKQSPLAIAVIGGAKHALLETNAGRVEVVVPPHREPVEFKLLIGRRAHADRQFAQQFAQLVKASPSPESFTSLVRGGPARWTQPIMTKGEVGKSDGPFAVDTLTLPYDNPHKALLFLGGVDFLPNGDVAICSAHGDVWLVQGVDAELQKLTWKRFATGLYQPLGLKVVDGAIHVLERGQLTRLHDLNNDGEADFYECVANDWDTGPGEHSYDTCLETDPQGNFYFFKTGDTHLPTGGTLLRVSKNGGKTEIFCTGFRHPIGLGVSPDGLVTGADQEGNWMPATRIDQYRQGGFYGDMRANHRLLPPKLYDGPLCWLPRQMDNSAGGQVWVPASPVPLGGEGRVSSFPLPPGGEGGVRGWGPLAGQCLHFSYGRCKLMLLLRQELEGVVQGGAVDLGVNFLSGSMRGRFNPRDGHLYVVGMDGWQTAAQKDGCLQRVRYTGRKLYLPIGLAVQADGVKLSFTEPLDKRTAEDVSRYQIAQWNYRWSGDYGSKRWCVTDANKVGQDGVPVQGVELLPDGKSVFVKLADVKPVMQMEIAYRLLAADGRPISGVIYNTIHKTASPMRR